MRRILPHVIKVIGAPLVERKSAAILIIALGVSSCAGRFLLTYRSAGAMTRFPERIQGHDNAVK